MILVAISRISRNVSTAVICKRSHQAGIPLLLMMQSFVFIKSWTGICACHFLIVALEVIKNVKKSHGQKTSKDCSNVHFKNSNHQNWNNRDDQKVPPPKFQDGFSTFPDDIFLNFRRGILIFFHKLNIPQPVLIKT